MNSEDSSSGWELEKQIDKVCERFEKGLRSGTRPQIADNLDDVAEPGQGKLLHELLLLEWEHCDTSNIPWSVESYLDKFPGETEIIEKAAVNYRKRSKREPAKETDLDLAAEEDTDLITLASLRAGREVGQYVLEERLGAGGIGIVFLARQLRTDRRVALKFLNLARCDPQKRTELRERFLQEPKAVARLQHDHIVTVYEAGEYDGLPFFSMQLIDGPSLRVLTAEGPIDCREAATYIRNVADAIQHAHQHKVLHRDIKPGNVLVGPDDRPYVTDFGMAKFMMEDVTLTQEGRGLGTVSYVSPEQAANAANVDERSDIYGIGATLYCLITGRPPFQAATTREILTQVQMIEPVAPRQLNPIVDRDLETICLKCLAKIPEHRYASALELQQDLVRYLDGAPILARPVSVTTRTWRWLRRRPAVALALALAACLVLLPSIAGPLWALRESELRALRDKDFARSTVDGARLKIQVGQWQDAIRLCEQSSSLPVENRTDVIFIASDALAALGNVERRERMLAELEPADLTPEQRNRLLLDLADTARLAGETAKYQELLDQVDMTRLSLADKSFVEALRAESLEASIPHLESALRYNSWHFEAFTELLAAFLLLDEVEKLEMLTLDSSTRYKEDSSTHLARALAAAAVRNEPLVEELLGKCQQELSPDDAKKAESLVRLISATRKVEVPWYTRLGELQAELDSHLSHLRSELVPGRDNGSEPSSRLIKLLPQVLMERFNTSTPRGVVGPIFLLRQKNLWVKAGSGRAPRL